jgi:hypothetical protein
VIAQNDRSAPESDFASHHACPASLGLPFPLLPQRQVRRAPTTDQSVAVRPSAEMAPCRDRAGCPTFWIRDAGQKGQDDANRAALYQGRPVTLRGDRVSPHHERDSKPRRVGGVSCRWCRGPAAWSQVASDVLAQKYFRKAGVRLKRVEEETVPSWLWRSVADDTELKALAEKERMIGEHSAKQVFDRLAGTWTYWGWKGGYFDSEDDARAFFDEQRYMLAMQMVAPNSPRWFAPAVDGGTGNGPGSRRLPTDDRLPATRRDAWCPECWRPGCWRPVARRSGAVGPVRLRLSSADLWRRSAAAPARRGARAPQPPQAQQLPTQPSPPFNQSTLLPPGPPPARARSPLRGVRPRAIGIRSS